MNMVLSFLDENRERLQLDRYGATGGLTCITKTPRFRASRHIVSMILPRGKTDPLLVAKVPRIAGDRSSVDREAANLRAVERAWKKSSGRVPRLVGLEDYHGYPILVETALVGRLIEPSMVRQDRDNVCRDVTSWLTQLQRGRRRAIAADGDWFDRLVEEPLHRLEQSLPMSADEKTLLARACRVVGTLRGERLPLVPEHGDLSHPNLLRLNDGGIGVVDWELAQPQGLPCQDLFFFLTYAAFASDDAAKTDHLRAFDRAFFTPSSWTRPHVWQYVERLALPWQILSPLFVLCWTRYLAGLLDRLTENDGPKPVGSALSRWLRSNRYFQLWRHTLTNTNSLAWQ